ncbi:hypothetical protein XENTR_v10006717 [Xenopus tropicalis]|nr:hypothetical protein XENTR_v10006717 [Xenopus tropicalis]
MPLSVIVIWRPYTWYSPQNRKNNHKRDKLTRSSFHSNHLMFHHDTPLKLHPLSSPAKKAQDHWTNRFAVTKLQ